MEQSQTNDLDLQNGDLDTEDANVIREAMTDFWKLHSTEASVEEMMLDSEAGQLCEAERPEILSYLPPLAGKKVIELGAGIGRYTRELAKIADHVIAVDFMQKFLDKNKECNGAFNNVCFKQADVTQVDFPSQSADLIFSNWLFMYLNDAELVNLLRRMLQWLPEGGFMFCRESCNHQSGDKKRTVNPTVYRKGENYQHIFNTTILSDPDSGDYGFDLVLNRPLETYIKMKNNENQLVWLLQKVARKPSSHQNKGHASFQDFLDQQQYSCNGILRYEKIFGRTFVSTGGIDTTKQFVQQLNLQKGQRVLDVGCGIGGSAFYMAKEFGVTVLGIDLSTNMINIARQRAKEVNIGSQVTFEVADATRREYPTESFDVVYSRDTILHIADKLALFKRFYRYLTSGGRVMISDYCCSEGEHSEQFQAYVKQRGYNLLSPCQYGEVLKQAGFVHVRAEDRTDLFVESLKKELAKTEAMKEEFIAEFSQKDYDDIVSGWRDKLVRTAQGDQRWGFFYCEKP